MKKLLAAGVLLCFIFMTAAVIPAQAGEIDLLLEKLVDKGVLTASEAQQVKIETQEQVKKELATGKSVSLPAWVQNLKLKGDLRLRYQTKVEKTTNDATKDTNIGRIRLRLGLEAKINERLLAGIGIATGSGDPRSTNITFGGYSEKKTVVLDYGYAKYSPFSWLKLVGGKMLLGDTLWEPTDLIWDTDITPEGAMLQFNKKLGPNANFFLNTGVLIVDADTSSDNDAPMAYLVQPGVSYKLNDSVSLKSAFSFQDFSNTKSHVSSKYSSESNTGNTTKGTSSYVYDYKMINPALELNIKEPFKAVGLDVEFLKLYGEYVNNLAVSKGASGFSCGFKLGDSKIEKWGDWQVKYVYAMLGRDAVLDVLPDSDRY
ncbi:MAG: putative porin, partial [Candidatus Omnitrophica bacterium]|nr:putative porin [Candidatus Omnitrophota bacterium]